MAYEFEGIEIPVRCSDCGSNTLESLGWLKMNEELTCSSCKRTIRLDDDAFRDALVDAEKSIARIRKETK